MCLGSYQKNTPANFSESNLKYLVKILLMVVPVSYGSYCPSILLERPGVGAGALLGAALTLHLDSLLGLVGTEPTFLSVYFITTASSIKIECEK